MEYRKAREGLRAQLIHELGSEEAFNREHPLYGMKMEDREDKVRYYYPLCFSFSAGQKALMIEPRSMTIIVTLIM